MRLSLNLMWNCLKVATRRKDYPGKKEERIAARGYEMAVCRRPGGALPLIDDGRAPPLMPILFPTPPPYPIPNCAAVGNAVHGLGCWRYTGPMGICIMGIGIGIGCWAGSGGRPREYERDEPAREPECDPEFESAGVRPRSLRLVVDPRPWLLPVSALDQRSWL